MLLMSGFLCHKCLPNPCKNEQVCTNLIGQGYTCECEAPFTGDHCQHTTNGDVSPTAPPPPLTTASPTGALAHPSRPPPRAPSLSLSREGRGHVPVAGTCRVREGGRGPIARGKGNSPATLGSPTASLLAPTASCSASIGLPPRPPLLVTSSPPSFSLPIPTYPPSFLPVYRAAESTVRDGRSRRST
eukprot:2289964-Pyramimonas_sp.AAC.1